MVPSTVWTLHTAMCWSRLRSTAHMRVCGLVVICCSTLAGAAKVFSMGVCSHHCFPLRTREGLPIWKPSGRSRESRPTLSQDQHVPVQTAAVGCSDHSALSTGWRRREPTCSSYVVGQVVALGTASTFCPCGASLIRVSPCALAIF